MDGPSAPAGMSLNDWYKMKAQSTRRMEAPAASHSPAKSSHAAAAHAALSSLQQSALSSHSHSVPIMPVFSVSDDGDIPPVSEQAAAKGGFVKRFTSMVRVAADNPAPLVTFTPNSMVISGPPSGGLGVRALLETSSPSPGFGSTVGFNSMELKSRPDVVGFSSKAMPIPAAMREAFMEAKRRVAKLKEEGKPVDATAVSMGALGAYLAVPAGTKIEKLKKPGPEKKVAGASERLYPGPKPEPEPEPEPAGPVLRVKGASERLYPGPKPKDSDEAEQTQEQHEPPRRVKGASERLYPGPPREASNTGLLMDNHEAAPVAPPVKRVIGASSRLYPGAGASRPRRRGASSDSSSSSSSGSPAEPDAAAGDYEQPAPQPAERAQRKAIKVHLQRAPSVRAQPRGSDADAADTNPLDEGKARDDAPNRPEDGADVELQPLCSGKEASAPKSTKPKLVGKAGSYVGGKFVLFDPAAEAKKKPSLAQCMKNLKKRTPGIDLRSGGTSTGLHWMYRGTPGICAAAPGMAGGGVAGFMSPDNADSSFIPAVDWSKENSSTNASMTLGTKFMEWIERYTHAPIEHPHQEWAAELLAASVTTSEVTAAPELADDQNNTPVETEQHHTVNIDSKEYE